MSAKDRTKNRIRTSTARTRVASSLDLLRALKRPALPAAAAKLPPQAPPFLGDLPPVGAVYKPQQQATKRLAEIIETHFYTAAFQAAIQHVSAQRVPELDRIQTLDQFYYYVDALVTWIPEIRVWDWDGELLHERTVYLRITQFYYYFNHPQLEALQSPIAPIEGSKLSPISAWLPMPPAIVVKHIQWPIDELLQHSEHAAAFEGGIFCHSFLNTYDYHRMRTPVAGKVLEAKFIPGQVYLEEVFRLGTGEREPSVAPAKAQVGVRGECLAAFVQFEQIEQVEADVDLDRSVAWRKRDFVGALGCSWARECNDEQQRDQHPCRYASNLRVTGIHASACPPGEAFVNYRAHAAAARFISLLILSSRALRLLSPAAAAARPSACV